MICSFIFPGPVKTVRLDFDGQTVLDQAFRAHPPYVNPLGSLTSSAVQIAPSPDNQEGSGILGNSFDSFSI